jgi:hypothetical protein
MALGFISALQEGEKERKKRRRRRKRKGLTERLWAMQGTGRVAGLTLKTYAF